MGVHHQMKTTAAKKHTSSDTAVPKSSKHKISNNSHSKQRQSSVIKDKKNRSISIDDLFGEESSEEESSGAVGHSGGDESTSLSDDELNVIFGDTDLSENDPYEECLRIFNESNLQLQQQQQQAKAAEFAKKKEIVELPPLDEGKKRVAHPGASSRVTVKEIFSASISTSISSTSNAKPIFGKTETVSCRIKVTEGEISNKFTLQTIKKFVEA